MDHNALVSDNRETHEALRFQFIVIELDLAVTFYELAICTGNQESAVRNSENARRAYSAAEKSSRGISFTPAHADAIELRATRAQSLINSLGFFARNHR